MLIYYALIYAILFGFGLLLCLFKATRSYGVDVLLFASTLLVLPALAIAFILVLFSLNDWFFCLCRDR